MINKDPIPFLVGFIFAFFLLISIDAKKRFNKNDAFLKKVEQICIEKGFAKYDTNNNFVVITNK